MLKFSDIRCVAIADVQAKRREAGKMLVDEHYGNHDCRLHRDFRELLDDKRIDAVLIATGDHWHAAASILAAKAGKASARLQPLLAARCSCGASSRCTVWHSNRHAPP